MTYCRELPEVEVEDDEEGAELSAEDMGLILFDGQEIDLVEGFKNNCHGAAVGSGLRQGL
ncbi:MAG: hypothetical protein R2864_11565 [Syntrophotaleaceae bacterium]